MLTGGEVGADGLNRFYTAIILALSSAVFNTYV